MIQEKGVKGLFAYQKSYIAAMDIFQLSKKFPKKFIRSQIKSENLPDQFALILPKATVKEITRNIFSLNSQFQMVNYVKH